jgi:dipeptidyl aminopeptidase/acylaminoacyl peptidase
MMLTAVLIVTGQIYGCRSEEYSSDPSAIETTGRDGRDVAAGDEAHITGASPGDEFPILPLEFLMAPEEFTAPQISPDGQWISYIAPLNGTPNLFVAEPGDLSNSRPVTRHTDAGVRATDVSGNVLYRWHWDSSSIIYPKDYDGDENWDIHIVDIAGGQDRNLTPIKDKSVELLAYSRQFPNEALITIGVFGQNQPDVYRLNLDTGEKQLVMEHGEFIGFMAGHDLKVKLGVVYNPLEGLDIRRLENDGHSESIYTVSPSDLPAFTTAGYQNIIRFDAASQNVHLYDAQGRDKAALVRLNIHSGELTVLAEDERVDIGGVLYHPVDGSVQGYATNWTRNSWTAIDENIIPDFKALDGISDGDWTIISRSDDDRFWIIRYRLSHKPTAFYLYDSSDQSAKFLFIATPQLEKLTLSRLHPYVVTTDDGFDLVSYYMLPPWTDPDEDGLPDAPVPVVVLVHGGPSDERALFAFGSILHWLANRGYGVMYVNFRGSAGFGKAYMNAQAMEWGGRMHQDILDQVDWAVAKGIAPKDKVAILGGSYGGYEALVAMTMTPDVFACGISVVGPSNLEIGMPHWSEDSMAARVGDPRTEEGRTFLRSRSPINFAHQTKNPVLIGQGANDSRVPQAQSDTVVEKMQAAGVEVTYVVYPDEGHGFVRPANSVAFNAIMEVFLGQCLGGRYQPITTQIEGSSTQVPVGAEHIPGLPEALASRSDDGLARIEAVAVDPATLESYTGKYLIEEFQVNLTVSREGESLFLELPGQPRSEMVAVSETEFAFRISPSTVQFHKGDYGNVTHLILNSEGNETRANRN